MFVDTHLFIRTPEGFWPGLPYVVIQALKPTHLVLIEAEPGGDTLEAGRTTRPATETSSPWKRSRPS